MLRQVSPQATSAFRTQNARFLIQWDDERHCNGSPAVLKRLAKAHPPLFPENSMPDLPYRSALIVGAGQGISASVARRLSALGIKVALAARFTDKLASLAQETGAQVFSADASDARSVAALFDDVSARNGEPDIVLFNAGARAHGPLAELDPVAVQNAIAVTAFGGFLVVQQAA